LTQKPRDQPEGDDDDRQRYQFQTILLAKRLHPDLQEQLEVIAKGLDVPEPQPITIAPVLAADVDNDQEDDKDILEMLKTCVKAAQVLDKTCQRVIKKLQDNDCYDHEVTLAYASFQDEALYVDNKLWVPKSVRTEVI
jgi:hypothetical protein